MPPSERVNVRAIPDSVGAYAQAVANRDNGVAHIRELLGRGIGRTTAGYETSTRIHLAMSNIPPHPACEFLSNLVAATLVKLGDDDTAGVDSYPDLEHGVALARSLSAAGTEPLDIWLTLSNRLCNAMHGLPSTVVLTELSEMAAAGQLLLAEQQR